MDKSSDKILLMANQNTVLRSGFLKINTFVLYCSSGNKFHSNLLSTVNEIVEKLSLTSEMWCAKTCTRYFCNPRGYDLNVFVDINLQRGGFERHVQHDTESHRYHTSIYSINVSLLLLLLCQAHRGDRRKRIIIKPLCRMR